MKLWLLRHGEAQPQAASDGQRELTPLGRREVLQSAERLKGQPIDSILVSPYVRAQQTAALVCGALAYEGPLHSVSWLTPDSDLREVLSRLDAYAGNLLLVSHQPLVGALAGLLVHGHRQQVLPMQTASLASLQGDGVLAGGMALLDLAHPRVP